MRRNAKTEAQAAAGGEIPGGFFLANSACFAEQGNYCPAKSTARANCIFSSNNFSPEHWEVGFFH